MKRNVWKVRSLILVVFFTLVFSSLTLAQDKGRLKFQGILMELDLKKRVMVVNETTFSWDEKTIFNNDKEDPIPLDKLKTNDWVYVEGEYDKTNKKVARKIYLLPKYIDNKERNRYPFMQ